MKLRLFGLEITIRRARRRRAPRARPTRLRVGLLAKTETTFGTGETPSLADPITLAADAKVVRAVSTVRAQAPALGVGALVDTKTAPAVAARDPELIHSLAELEGKEAARAAGAIDCAKRGYHRVFVAQGTTPAPGSSIPCEDCAKPVPVEG